MSNCTLLSYNIQNFNQVLNDMNNENINLPEEDFNEGLEDIEQMLKPQCEFKASDTLKDEVLARARQEVKPQRKVKIWPWVAAACAVGFLMLWLTPPEKTQRDEVLHAYLVSTYHAKHQRAIYNQMDARESFEDIERKLRIEGAQLKEEFKMPNQIY